MTLYQKALHFATKAHEGITRKYTFEPYIVHPIQVASIVSKVTEDEEMVAAALLHDTVEDCGVLPEVLAQEFGERVASLVVELTNVSKPEDGNRKVRKSLDKDALATASADAQTIKVADLLSNTPSIVEHDPNFAKVYLKEKAELLTVLTQAHPVLLSEAREMLAQAQLQQQKKEVPNLEDQKPTAGTSGREAGQPVSTPSVDRHRLPRSGRSQEKFSKTN